MKSAIGNPIKEATGVTSCVDGVALVRRLCREEGLTPWQTTLVVGLFASIWPDAVRRFRHISGLPRESGNATVLNELISHSRRTARYAQVLAQKFGESQGHGLADARIYAEFVGAAATFHDIGKLTVPARLLGKSGRLEISEFAAIKEHPAAGARMIDRARGRASSAFLKAAKDVAAFHHERWNGGGYPFGLAGGQIPFVARLVAIADVYDAVSHDRVYASARSHDEAVEIVKHGSGCDFDPNLVEIFLQVSGEI